MRALVAAATAAALLGVAGCSGGGSDDPDSADIAALSWSPCDDLTAAAVGDLVGSPVKEHDGTETAPRCTFTPVEKGAPAYDVSYLWFDGGLDDALTAMGATGTQLEPIDIPGATAARMVVRPQKTGVVATAFVETDGLVQSVNAAQITPYDEDLVVSGTKALLTALVENAPTPPKG
jgi:hypothetical protein